MQWWHHSGIYVFGSNFEAIYRESLFIATLFIAILLIADFLKVLKPCSSRHILTHCGFFCFLLQIFINLLFSTSCLDKVVAFLSKHVRQARKVLALVVHPFYQAFHYGERFTKKLSFEVI